jgi:hypothetical protein
LLLLLLLLLGFGEKPP